MTLQTAPIPIRRALAWNAETHRRLPAVQGGMWAIAAIRDGTIVGVAIVGRPPRTQDTQGNKPTPVLVVLRLACAPDADPATGHKGACSILYAACARAARAMGATALLTYTHDDEPGTSLHAAGWIDDGMTTGGEHSREGRKRRPAIDSRPKRRWCAPWSVRRAEAA